jgi:DNA adenine methylase
MPISFADISPLRYPGSKACLVNYIDDLIKENYLEGCRFIEPFAGSAIVSIELLKRGTIENAVIIERDPLIYCFWKSVFEYTYDFVERINNLAITLDTWEKLLVYRNKDYNIGNIFNAQEIMTLGLSGLFFNRTSFSGILNAGPIGGKNQSSKYKIDCRFNKDRLIRKIVDISTLRDCVDVKFDDALVFLKKSVKTLKNEQCFIYADPPYFSKGKRLYRYWYNIHDHQKLARFLLSIETPWLVSYDDHEKIREIYSQAPGRWKIFTDYSISASSRRKDVELLISNLRIPPKSYELSLMQIS